MEKFQWQEKNVLTKNTSFDIKEWFWHVTEIFRYN